MVTTFDASFCWQMEMQIHTLPLTQSIFDTIDSGTKRSEKVHIEGWIRNESVSLCGHKRLERKAACLSILWTHIVYK